MDDGSLALRRLCTVPKTSVHLLSRKESEGRKRKGEGRCRRRRRARTVISFPCTAKVPLFHQIKSLCYTRSDEGTKVDDSLSLSLRNETSSHTGNESTANHSLERKKERKKTNIVRIFHGQTKSRDVSLFARSREENCYRSSRWPRKISRLRGIGEVSAKH